MNLDKVKSTLRQCIRDWSEVGKNEREMCYKPILDALKDKFKDEAKRRKVKVLNPGCGLGRLTWEIANMGFQSQGNEFSYHMLLASNLILNCTTKKEEFSIFPHIDQVANVWRFRDQCRKISVPDVFPRSLPENSNFSMVAGDFMDVYTEPGSWDVVVTCFFIDTAKNIFDYLATLSNIIPAGGYWINLGPLLFHFEEMMEPSVELTYEELRAIIPQFGFEFKDERLGVSSTYSRNELSMLQMAYNSAFFVCQRTDTPPIPTIKQTLQAPLRKPQPQPNAPRGHPPHDQRRDPRVENNEWAADYPANRPPGPSQPFPSSANSMRAPGPMRENPNAEQLYHRGDPSRNDWVPVKPY
jgi:carnosine N-methyltransferase